MCFSTQFLFLKFFQDRQWFSTYLCSFHLPQERFHQLKWINKVMTGKLQWISICWPQVTSQLLEISHSIQLQSTSWPTFEHNHLFFDATEELPTSVSAWRVCSVEAMPQAFQFDRTEKWIWLNYVLIGLNSGKLYNHFEPQNSTL